MGGGFIRYFFRALNSSGPRNGLGPANKWMNQICALQLIPNYDYISPHFFIRQKRLLLERRLAPSPLFKASLGPFAAPGSAHSASLPQNRRKSDSRRRPAPGGGGAAAPVGARERLSRKGTSLKPRATFYDLNCSRAEQ